tara:strand:- start:1427 stop:1978 length:552 start_codon:yes stop_codon:yes gene_type:complete
MTSKFEVVSSKYVYQGRVVHLRTDNVRTFLSDKTVCREVVEHSGSVGIVAIDEDDNVYLVSQYRHAVDKVLMEIPAGTLEKGESSIETAKRELREEIGMSADHLISTGSFYLAPGYSSEIMEVYIAKGLKVDPLPKDVDEDIVVHMVPFEKLVAQICSGEFTDIKTVAAVLLVARNNALLGSS